MRKYSIFDNVLSPICPGPSAGCTGGSTHIGRVARKLLGEPPCKMKVEMCSKGIFRTTLISLRNDIAMVNGILGREGTDPRFLHAFEDARKAGLQWEFIFRDDLPLEPKHYLLFTLTGAETGRVIQFEADEMGGGNFRVWSFMGRPVDIQGYDYDILLLCGTMDQAEQDAVKAYIANLAGDKLNRVEYGQGKEGGIFDVKFNREPDAEQMKKMSEIEGVYDSRLIYPENPVVMDDHKDPLFTTPEELLAYAEKTQKPLWQVAVDYEKSLGSFNDQQVLDYAEQLWQISEEAIQDGYEGDFDMNGVVPRRAAEIKKAFDSGKLLDLGPACWAAPTALSIMEHSNGSGTVVCMPTAGSAGLVPATVQAVCKKLDLGREGEIHGLLVAGLMGVFMAKSNFTGSLGCVAEVGCGIGMAAGAVVSLLGGTARQALDAASMGIQLTFGMTCNSVCTLAQVPCFIRNMVAPGMAMMCANCAMAGLDALIPLDEIVDSMITLGRVVLEAGGNPMNGSGTPTGLRLEEDQAKRNRALRGEIS